MKTSCKHGSILPRGLKCDRGYLRIRIKEDGHWLPAIGCGPHTPKMEQIARLKLDDIRLKQKLGTLNLPQKIKRLRFCDALLVYHNKWFVDYRDPKTNKHRSAISTATTMSHLRALNSFFSDYFLDAITVKAILAYRKKRLEYDGVSHGTVNRDLAVLGSLLSKFKEWIEAEEISLIKMPVDKQGAACNPCTLIPDLEEMPRTIDYDYKDAIRRLYLASTELKDPGMWAIIETELDTTLRKNDLETYFKLEKQNGYVTLTQSKTGTKVTLPEIQHPNWANVFVNFDIRWDRIRKAAGYPTMWFRDLRKIGMLLLEELGHSPEDIASTAGHSDSKITKKWYLSGKFQADKNRPLIEARRKLIEEIKTLI